MDISTYFEPVDIEKIGYRKDPNFNALGDHIIPYTTELGFPDLTQAKLAIIGVAEDRGAMKNKGCAEAPDLIRKKLYALAEPLKEMTLLDLGTIQPGNSIDDTRFALTEVLFKLMDKQLTVIILGGSQDLTYSAYKAYEVMGKIVNICAIDSRLDLSDDSDVLHARNYIRHIVMDSPNYLFDFTTLGYQSYFVGPQLVALMDQLQFNHYRLGELQEHMVRAESCIRNAELVSIDMGSVRQSDAPGNGDPSPHGFYGEELCRLSRYAGMSETTNCIGFFEANPQYDRNLQTSHLTAHAIWFFIEAFYARKYENPYYDKQNFKRFTVEMKEQGVDIVFYKSKQTERWWMEVPSDTDTQQRYSHHLLLPCTYDDYLHAMDNEIPELWWRNFTRIQMLNEHR